MVRRLVRPRGAGRRRARTGAARQPGRLVAPPRALVAAFRPQQPAPGVPLRRLWLPRAPGARMIERRRAERIAMTPPDNPVSVVGARIIDVSPFGMLIASRVAISPDAVLPF